MKYKNKKTVLNGVAYDSKKEALKLEELRLLEKAGKIKDLTFKNVYYLRS